VERRHRPKKTRAFYAAARRQPRSATTAPRGHFFATQNREKSKTHFWNAISGLNAGGELSVENLRSPRCDLTSGREGAYRV